MKTRDVAYDVAQTVHCPTCGSEPGRRCKLSAAGRRNTPQRDRRLLAADLLAKLLAFADSEKSGAEPAAFQRWRPYAQSEMRATHRSGILPAPTREFQAGARRARSRGAATGSATPECNERLHRRGARRRGCFRHPTIPHIIPSFPTPAGKHSASPRVHVR
jgi:hypothetical protein